MVCRLSGTNSELGKKIFDDYSASHKGFKIINADCLEDAAALAVKYEKIACQMCFHSLLDIPILQNL